jgi:hypothetical protein
MFIVPNYKIQIPMVNCILHCGYTMQHKFIRTRAFKGVANKGIEVDLIVFDIYKNLHIPMSYQVYTWCSKKLKGWKNMNLVIKNKL